jgi:hypothetical protein
MRGRGYLAFFVGICLTAWTCYFVLEEQQKQQVRAGFQRDAERWRAIPRTACRSTSTRCTA